MILLGLGANLSGKYGSAAEALQACPDVLARHGVFIRKSSNLWKSAPVPISDQPWYHNAVCVIETHHNPKALLEAINAVEEEFGRVRHIRNEARVLDLDILSYNNDIIGDDSLSLPHPRMHERAFVLCPLQEIAPNWLHPALGKSVEEMIADMPKGQEIERVEGSALQFTIGDKV